MACMLMRRHELSVGEFSEAYAVFGAMLSTHIVPRGDTR